MSDLVTVVVPLHNGARYITETLKSILHETRVPLEIVVIDDHSTDDSAKRVLAIGDARIRLVESEARGIPHTINTGLAIARGSLIMRCDADDTYPENRIYRQACWLRENELYGAVCGAFSTIDARSKLIAELECGAVPTEITTELKAGKVRTHLCTYAIRADVLRLSGYFRPFFETAEDIDLQLRLAEQTRIYYLPEAFYKYRLHHDSITHQQSTPLREFFNNKAQEFRIQRHTVGRDDLQNGLTPERPVITTAKPTPSGEHIQGILLGRAWSEYQKSDLLRASQVALRALFTNPTNLKAWKSVIALLARVALRQKRQ